MGCLHSSCDDSDHDVYLEQVEKHIMYFQCHECGSQQHVGHLTIANDEVTIAILKVQIHDNITAHITWKMDEKNLER